MKQVFFILSVLTLLLSIPSLLRIPRVLPFLDADVRAAAPAMLDQLREKGLWLVNTDLRSVEKSEGQLCFQWKSSYTKRTGKGNIELITTCMNEAL